MRRIVIRQEMELLSFFERLNTLDAMEEDPMNIRIRSVSLLLLFAMVLSLVPALALPSSASAATCNWAQFVADVTVPDGTKFAPGTTFKKTWRLKNIGTCTWTTGYALVFDSGERMGAPATVTLPSSVAPGATIDLSVDMTAPNNAGRYIGYWKLRNAAGGLFGIGSTANKSFWVEINVTGTSTGGVVYDFTANANSATWSSGAGGLSFPGTDGDAKGFALKKDKPKFESGVEATQPGLLLAPQNITNGFIQGRYTAFKVQSGDRFQATIGCEFGATSCYVAYRLDYEVGSSIKTFWTFRERYEGLTYNANLDLTPLAGQEVRFILYISAYGSPAGDRALWGNPVIVRKGGVTPPPPTVTGTPPTATPTKPVTQTVPPSSCDKAQFIKDVTVPDGTVLAPGATFTKTWRLKNVGTCAWTTSYQLAFYSGDQMGAPSSAMFPQNVAVGQTVDVSINMTAPSTAGSYRGYWMFKNASGTLFGIGAQANKPWWVDIKVSGPTATPGGPTKTPTPTATSGGPTATPVAGSAYDFVANACSASWFSGAGQLPCPGTDGDAKGFVLKINNPKLETGVTDSRPGLLTFPQNVQNGYIQGIYPVFKVQSGDRFRSIINCEGGATNCYVVFRLDYQTGNDPIKTFWGPFLERYEGMYYSMDVDLTPLAGKDVKFILTVLAAGVATGDRALWVGPYIYRGGSSSGAPAQSATETATTSSTSGWDTFQNNKYGFSFKYPSGSTPTNQTDNSARIFLPITTGTNLIEKYLDVSVVESANPCKSPDPGGPITGTETVTINGIQFLKETGEGAAAGNLYEFTAYSSASNNACVTLMFVLHSANIGNYTTPPPEFNKAAESAVFDLIIKTFDWIG
jgi:hypothetical protein